MSYEATCSGVVPSQRDRRYANYGVVHTYVGCSEAQIDEGVIPVSLH